MRVSCQVIATKNFEKQLKKLPVYIKEAVAIWVASVEEEGIYNIRKLKGYHDEPLKGVRRGQRSEVRGQRSVRLNRAYRLIYREDKKSQRIEILILEVHKHEY